MPELPEIETIKLGLQPKIIGLTITDIEVLNPKTFQGNPKDVLGGKVVEVFRRAKVLGVILENAKHTIGSSKNKDSIAPLQNDKQLALLFHLKMSGQMILIQNSKGVLVGGHPTPDMAGAMPNKSTRVIFSFSDPLRREASKSRLFFNDQRKFGWIKVVCREQLAGDSFFGSLGPEPLEKGFSWEVLKSQLWRRKNQPVKIALLDQTLVAGIGNIYASESCFLASLDPRRAVSSLSDKDFQKLHHGIVKSLKVAIKHGGSTRSHYVNIEGKKGNFLDYAFVYNRDKQTCKVCGTEIKKITLGTRGTYFCPKCQK